MVIGAWCGNWNSLDCSGGLDSSHRPLFQQVGKNPYVVAISAGLQTGAIKSTGDGSLRCGSCHWKPVHSSCSHKHMPAGRCSLRCSLNFVVVSWTLWSALHAPSLLLDRKTSRYPSLHATQALSSRSVFVFKLNSVDFYRVVVYGTTASVHHVSLEIQRIAAANSLYCIGLRKPSKKFPT